MPLFETLNLDYCCGGHRSLAEACAQAGKDLTQVLSKLEALQASAPADPKRWQGRSLTELMAHIEATHHPFTRSELARVAPLMGKVLEVHGAHHPELARVAQCFQGLFEDLGPHLDKEEQILFPFIRTLEAGGAPGGACFGSVENPIRAMLHDHEQVGGLLREIRDLTRDYLPPEDACASYRSLLTGLRDLEEDLHLHIHLENHVLFPGATAQESAQAS
jgi:regulator of cell morphogenesis and NO signaling